MHPVIKKAREDLESTELEYDTKLFGAENFESDDDFDIIDHKIHNNLQTNYLSEKNEIHFLKLELQKLEHFREATLQDLRIKYNLTIRKIEQLQQSHNIDAKHQKFLSTRIQSQIEEENIQQQTILENKQQTILLNLKNTKQQIQELQEKMSESEKSHVARKLKLENAIVEIDDQLKELDEKESSANEARKQILSERRALEKRLESKLYELELAKARLAHAKQDYQGLSAEVSEFNA